MTDLAIPTPRADSFRQTSDTAQPRQVPSPIAELSAALLAPQASIAPKYLYDALGSKLFEAICEVPEYYPTRTEAAIFEARLAQIAASVGSGTTLVDLGAGNCAKAVRLFPALAPSHYVPVDISFDFLQQAVEPLRQRFPNIAVHPIGQDFSGALRLPPEISRARRLFFYPGSSIGNFTPDEALLFLRGVRELCDGDGGLLIGVDLVKHHAVLDAAYDDALGVTAAFNLNLLRHVNRLLDADFDVRQWRHQARFNSGQSRIEMHLQSLRSQTVHWPGGQRHFAEGELLHTENSYKYTVASFVNLLEQAGFANVRVWTDDQEWFAVAHAHAA